MSSPVSALPPQVVAFPPLPDHTQLPDKDEAIGTNTQEHPQSTLLSSSLEHVLQRLHPDGQYAIGMDVGIYYRYRHPNQFLCKAPDWIYIPVLPPMLEGQVRRSFVMWQEAIDPVLLIEYASGDSSEERDQTPETGKFWVYERVIRPAFYAIYEVTEGRVTVYELVNNRFKLVPPNDRGHFPIPPLEVELGTWQGRFLNLDLPWLRFWDAQGNLLLSGSERAEQEHQRAEQEHQRAERLAALLRSLGHDPDAVS